MTGDANGPVAIDYVVDGPHTAAAVASGRSKLVGMSYARASAEPRFVSEDVGSVLRDVGAHHRLYHDALFGCAVELQHDLPLPKTFDDTRIMLHLLGQETPPALAEPAPATLATSKQASLARTRRITLLYPQLTDRIEAERLHRVYREVELPVVAPTLAMMLRGLPVSCSVLERIQASHDVQREIARRQVAERIGREINIDSAEEVAGLLYDELRLPVPASAAGKRTTALRALESLIHAHPAVGPLTTCLRTKPVSGAARALLAHVAPTSHRVFAELNPLGAATGRFSCSKPNIQGLTDPVLEAVEARPGCVLLEADISQAELRVLAHFSQDARLLEAYQHHDVDIHSRTAAAVLGIPEQQVAEKQRNVGKRVNFAVIYGVTPMGLSRQLDISEYEAERLLSAYFTAHPGVRQWVDEVHAHVRRHGRVETLFGRRRRLPDVWAADQFVAAKALKQAVNAIIQGTAADLLKLALIRLHSELPDAVGMLMTCHDSVLLEVPQDLVAETRRLTCAALQSRPPSFSVPIRVDVGVGPTWAACKRG